MLAGLLLILLPLIVGYLIPVRDERVLAAINRGVNLSVYAILGLMGISLTGLENLGGQLARMSAQAALLFAVITPLNLAALWWLSRRSRVHAGTSKVVAGAPTSKLAACLLYTSPSPRD